MACFKKNSSPKNENTHPQDIQNIDEFFLHQNRFGALHHSPMDPLQWMGPVRMRVQTADENIPIIHKHHDSSPLMNIMWSKELHICMKQIHHWDVFNFKALLLAKYESSIHIITFSSRLSQERNIHRSSPTQSKTVLNKYFNRFWCERTVGELWGELFHCRKCHYNGLLKWRLKI